MEQGFVVPPTSRDKIRRFTDLIRRNLDGGRAWFDIVRFLELVMPELVPGFTLWIRGESEMGSAHGLTEPDKKRIQIREDVYIGALCHNGRDRMTLAHELGHFVLHQNVSYARLPASGKLAPFRSSEWQANAFGGELLMCHFYLDGIRCPEDMVERFGVSLEAARVQFNVFRREGLL